MHDELNWSKNQSNTDAINLQNVWDSYTLLQEHQTEKAMKHKVPPRWFHLHLASSQYSNHEIYSCQREVLNCWRNVHKNVQNERGEERREKRGWRSRTAIMLSQLSNFLSSPLQFMRWHINLIWEYCIAKWETLLQSTLSLQHTAIL